MQPCPLCVSNQISFFHQDARRDYLRCQNCLLVFVPKVGHLDPIAEKAQYDLHQNSPDDPGYRKFLSRLFNPLSDRLQPGSCGLDFGCGPGPTLSVMFDEAGFEMTNYDIFYAPDKEALNRRYDFITATEVVEHLSQPGQVLQKLWQMLLPGGYLGIMTKQVVDVEAFARWHYKNDPTHIAFFCRQSFIWLADQWQVAPEFIGSDVVFFKKGGAPC